MAHKDTVFAAYVKRNLAPYAPRERKLASSNGIARLVRETREKMGLKQEDFAKLLGVTRAATVSDWERGESQPEPPRLADITKLATEYGIDAASYTEQTVEPVVGLSLTLKEFLEGERETAKSRAEAWRLEASAADRRATAVLFAELAALHRGLLTASANGSGPGNVVETLYAFLAAAGIAVPARPVAPETPGQSPKPEPD